MPASLTHHYWTYPSVTNPDSLKLVDKRIPIFTDDPGWHGEQLRQAFAARGWEAVFVSLRDCWFEFSQSSSGVCIPGFEHGLPQGVFVRGVSGGTLQQVTMRLDILHALKSQGILVYNNGRAIERTVDKAMTSFLLHQNGVPTPATWVCESREQARKIMLREHMAERQLVMKPVFGSQGIGVRRLAKGQPMPVPMDEHVDGVFYLQNYVDTGDGEWHDYRVFVISNKVNSAMVRYGNQWVNNVAQGGRCESLCVDEETDALAVAAAKAVEIDYCGVDIIRDRSGKLYVLEVNSIPAWRGLQQVTTENIAQSLVDDFLALLSKRTHQAVAAV